MRPILVKHKGKLLTLRQLAEKTGISFNTIKDRYKAGKRGKDLAAPLQYPIVTRLAEYRGKTLSLRQLSKKANFPFSTIRDRYRAGKRGKDLIAPIQYPNRASQIMVEYRGKLLSLRQLSEKTGISYSTIRYRYCSGKRGKDLLAAKNQKKQYRYRGQMRTMEEIASIAKVPIWKARYCHSKYRSFKRLDSADSNPRGQVLCAIDGKKYRARDLARLLNLSMQAIYSHRPTKAKAAFKKWVLQKMASTKTPQKRKPASKRKPRA